MLILLCIFIFIIGACLGSFLCCQARRLHLRATHPSKPKTPKSKAKSTSKPQNLKNPQTPKTAKLPTHSICLACQTKLKWYDNLPIISWLILKGKCRKCHAKIGLAELLAEIFTALALLAVSIAFFQSTIAPTSPLDFTGAADIDPPFIATLTALDWLLYATLILLTLSLIFLAIYDALYQELPTFALILALILSAIFLALNIYQHLSAHPFTASVITDPLFATLILGGLYLALYLISKGRWVGDGDYILATIIALALGTPWLALVALFLSNVLATIIAYSTLKGQNKRKQKIPFGPFLVAAFVLTYTFAYYINALI